MSINSTNPNPRSPNYLASILPVDDDKFVMMDIGARGGIAPSWKPIGEMARIIGFDPDPDECERLNHQELGVEFVPFDFASDPGKRTFYLTELEYCHGLSPSNEEFLDRFPNAINNSVRAQVEIEADAIFRAGFLHSETGVHIC